MAAPAYAPMMPPPMAAPVQAPMMPPPMVMPMGVAQQHMMQQQGMQQPMQGMQQPMQGMQQPMQGMQQPMQMMQQPPLMQQAPPEVVPMQMMSPPVPELQQQQQQPDMMVNKQRSASVASVDMGASLDWAVPHQSKLRYTQVFNSNDRTRCGHLTGSQARTILIQWGIPQAALAKIW